MPLFDVEQPSICTRHHHVKQCELRETLFTCDEHGLESWTSLPGGQRIRVQTVAHLQNPSLVKLNLCSPANRLLLAAVLRQGVES